MGKIKGNREFIARTRPARPLGAKRSAITGLAPALGYPTIPLDELARCQGVKPVSNLNELGSLWPDEFNPDEFLNWLYSERMARRKVAVNTTAEPD